MRRVERAAWSTLAKCIKVKKLKALPLPIPVEEWVEGPLGIRLDIADLSHQGADVLGASWPKDREIAISKTLVHQNARFRFTVAHELGHIVLHEKISPHFRDAEGSDFMARKFEREADRFAAAFLMPIPALCSEFASVGASLWNDPESLLRLVARGDPSACDMFKAQVLPHLSERFAVSTAVAVRRFGDVQFPTGEVAMPYEVGHQFLPPGLAMGFLSQ